MRLYYITETPNAESDDVGETMVHPRFFLTFADQQHYIRDEIKAQSYSNPFVFQSGEAGIYCVEFTYYTLSAGDVDIDRIQPYEGDNE